jgi:crossover junction endodeoxyribonuclease RuvC
VKVLGVDPGSQKMGISYLAGIYPHFSQVVWESVSLPKGSLSSRLLEVEAVLSAYLKRFKPDVCVMEEPFVYRNPRSFLVLGMIRGVIHLLMGKNGIEVVGYPPTRVKKMVATGGFSSKEELRWILMRELSLTSLPPLDASDALAVALAHHLFMQVEGRKK